MKDKKVKEETKGEGDPTWVQIDRLKSENKYISNLFKLVPFPSKQEQNDSSGEDDGQEEAKAGPLAKRSRLEEKLSALRGKRLDFQGKKERTKLKKKLAQTQPTPKTQLVFSKFDFSAGRVVDGPSHSKRGANPKRLLQHVLQERERLSESGLEQKAWNSALKRASGERVRDDPALLKKAIQNKQHQKRVGQRKWKERKEQTQHKKEDRQARRERNLQKKKGERKEKKVKRLRKKGRIVD